ncbi:ANTAR domain-containing response regulator [Effusibacillus pohliae]|uniref:ANTAR domain-containing response regulator n=1 Tax=Effusibacillus pohliae TaxID=232270 RepID=UPI000381DEEF|nr:ANTAR domain-containing protein [Effusibacillus pohliae]
MRDEIVVIGSGNRLNGWLPSVLAECPYRLRFVQVPQQPESGEQAVAAIAVQVAAEACILQDDVDLASWTQALLQAEQGPVLWAVARLNRKVVRLFDEIGAKGILTPATDPLAAVCSVKTAVAGWQSERMYRKRAEQALTELNNRKLIERAKGLLMDRFALSEAEAYGRIRREAMRNRKSMVQIAESILLLQDLTDMSG